MEIILKKVAMPYSIVDPNVACSEEIENGRKNWFVSSYRKGS